MAENTEKKTVPSWRKKYARKKRFIRSGRPRDIVGLYDNKQIENHYQLQNIHALEKRDAHKFLGTKSELNQPDLPFPDPIIIPNNQPLSWYVTKGMTFAQLHKFGDAFWFFSVAAKKALRKGSQSQQARYLEIADSNLKEWRSAS